MHDEKVREGKGREKQEARNDGNARFETLSSEPGVPGAC
jgi:hypothetical protein